MYDEALRNCLNTFHKTLSALKAGLQKSRNETFTTHLYPI